ncbi:MAG: enoyl-[acyl-carrier-protein] reductase FabL [Chloroflexi bacterium]|nr:enoyl-[acyl-carrier-protein] reductase FabL [Chloroflexota bacterium]|tara:strand:- start:84 stop:830 length:747 start_codon:yes stop_codon:yes gene_type:complete
MSFNNKVVLITGGSRGIGKQIALNFAQQGSNIIFSYLKDHKSAKETEEEILQLGVQCLKIKAHLGDVEKIKSMFKTIKSKFGKLDILINNAASGIHKKAEDLSEKHWDWTMNINSKAPWLCAIEASKIMPKGSKIINITSQGSQRVLPYYFSVGTSKAALEAITRYLAVELSYKEIAVNAVSAGYIYTDALEHFPNKSEMIEASKNNLSNRPIEANDIAKVISFLCTKDAEMIRGQVIIVDGGYSLNV